MSDPVKSSEIEDVLASIRRLVSEEARSEIQTRRQSATQPEDAPETANPSEAETANPPESEAPAADALVLTPALRVHEGGRAAATVPLAPQDENAATDRPETADHEPEPAEAPEPDVDWADATDHADEESHQPSESPEIAGEDDLPEPPSEPQSLEAKIAALEALIAGSAAARQPAEDAPAGDGAEDRVETPREAADEAWQSEADVEDSPDISEAEDALEWQDHQRVPDDAEPEKVAAEDSGPAEDPAQTLEMAELHDVETVIHELAAHDGETAAAPEVDQVATDDDTPQEPPSTEALPIDEAVLREMVIEIVREELQGALGERITRNVRRLVRREIHRALATQELD